MNKAINSNYRVISSSKKINPIFCPKFYYCYKYNLPSCNCLYRVPETNKGIHFPNRDYLHKKPIINCFKD